MVFQTLLSMEVDKVPGSDGFTIAFSFSFYFILFYYFLFRSCWFIVKADLMNFFHNFHEHERFVKSLNATFITLILKKLGQL